MSECVLFLCMHTCIHGHIYFQGYCVGLVYVSMLFSSYVDS